MNLNELRNGRVRIADGARSAEGDDRSDEFQIPDRAGLLQRSKRQLLRLKLCLRIENILAIFCRGNSPHVTKDLCKVLLPLEATGHCHVQHARIESTQHRFGALEPLAQNKLMRSLAR